MLRLVLDWSHRGVEHELSFLSGARWCSEVASEFLPERRSDDRAEFFTHADGVIGHFAVRPGERGEAILLPGASQFVVVEARLGSGLSAGVKNAPDYDQAARNVACMAHVMGVAGVSPKALERLAFYVVAPQSRIEAGAFGELVTKRSIHRKVAARVARYGGAKDEWFREAFEPALEHADVGTLPWESILDRTANAEDISELREFYARCLEFNLSSSEG